MNGDGLTESLLAQAHRAPDLVAAVTPKTPPVVDADENKAEAAVGKAEGRAKSRAKQSTRGRGRRVSKGATRPTPDEPAEAGDANVGSTVEIEKEGGRGNVAKNTTAKKVAASPRSKKVVEKTTTSPAIADDTADDTIPSAGDTYKDLDDEVASVTRKPSKAKSNSKRPTVAKKSVKTTESMKASPPATPKKSPPTPKAVAVKSMPKKSATPSSSNPFSEARKLIDDMVSDDDEMLDAEVSDNDESGESEVGEESEGEEEEDGPIVKLTNFSGRKRHRDETPKTEKTKRGRKRAPIDTGAIDEALTVIVRANASWSTSQILKEAASVHQNMMVSDNQWKIGLRRLQENGVVKRVGRKGYIVMRNAGEEEHSLPSPTKKSPSAKVRGKISVRS